MVASNSTVAVAVAASATVDDLKTAVGIAAGLDGGSLLVVFKGRRLQDPDGLVAAGVADGDTVFAGAGPAAATKGAPGTAAASTSISSAAGVDEKPPDDPEKARLVAAMVTAITTMKT